MIAIARKPAKVNLLNLSILPRELASNMSMFVSKLKLTNISQLQPKYHNMPVIW